mgnify:CR=1 FL=1
MASTKVIAKYLLLKEILASDPIKIDISLSNISGVYYIGNILYINAKDIVWKFNCCERKLSVYDKIPKETHDMISLISSGYLEFFSFNNHDYFRISNHVKVFDKDVLKTEYEFSKQSQTCLFSDPCINVYKLYNLNTTMNHNFIVTCIDFVNSNNWNLSLSINPLHCSKYKLFSLRDDVLILSFTSQMNNNPSYNIINNKLHGLNFKSSYLYNASYIPEINRSFLRFSEIFYILHSSAVDLMYDNNIETIKSYIDEGKIANSMYFGYDEQIKPVFVHNYDIVLYIYKHHICYSKTTHPYTCNPLYELPNDFEPTYIHYIHPIPRLLIFSNSVTLEYNLF